MSERGWGRRDNQRSHLITSIPAVKQFYSRDSHIRHFQRKKKQDNLEDWQLLHEVFATLFLSLFQKTSSMPSWSTRVTLSFRLCMHCSSTVGQCFGLDIRIKALFRSRSKEESVKWRREDHAFPMYIEHGVYCINDFYARDTIMRRQQILSNRQRNDDGHRLQYRHERKKRYQKTQRWFRECSFFRSKDSESQRVIMVLVLQRWWWCPETPSSKECYSRSRILRVFFWVITKEMTSHGKRKEQPQDIKTTDFVRR